MLSIDHVLLAVADLETAAADVLARTGLAAVTGGRHPGWGTANRIVPLGDAYLELVTVVDAEEAAGAPFGQLVAGALARGGGACAWCVASDRLAEDAARLGLEPTRASRAAADGSVLRWSIAGIEAALAAPWRPFLIAWDMPPERHPGRLPADHRVMPHGIARLELAAPADELDRWLDRADLPLTLVGDAGPPGIRAVWIDTAEGALALG